MGAKPRGISYPKNFDGVLLRDVALAVCSDFSHRLPSCRQNHLRKLRVGLRSGSHATTMLTAIANLIALTNSCMIDFHNPTNLPQRNRL